MVTENDQERCADESGPLLGAIEAGGTKIVCAVARDPAAPLLEERFPTVNPSATVDRIVEFFRRAAAERGAVAALGVGTFGPAGLHPGTPAYGSILRTPKEGWSGFDLLGALRAGLGEGLPVAFETDVNAALIGEARFGNARGVRYPAYVTVGTGIGGAFLHEGRLLRGRMHPEIGHLVMFGEEPALEGEGGTGACRFHRSCFEGRASGPAVERRWGSPGDQLPDDHPAWALEARYLAAGCVSLTAAWSPDLIILGGGVSQKEGLIERARREFAQLAGGYWELPPLERYLVPPGLGQQAGIVGALCLARDLLGTVEVAKGLTDSSRGAGPS
jgi:fructokinase